MAAGIVYPGDNAVINYLQHWSGTFKIDYVDKVADLTRRFGKTTRAIPTSKKTLNGNVFEYEFIARPNNGARVTYDLLAPNTPASPGQYGRYNVTFNAENPALNDFMKINIGFRLTWYDIQKRSDSNFKDPAGYIERDVRQGIEGVAEVFARSFHLPADGALGVVATSGKMNADSDIFALASAYTSGSAICLLKLNANAMQRIGDGQRLELRTSAGVLRANNLIAERVLWGDYSVAIRVAGTSNVPGPSVDSAGATVTNCDAFVATDVLYLNGCYNVVPKLNLASYFTPSTSFFGKARLSDENYRMLLPNRADAGNNSSGGTNTAPLTADMIHDMGRTLAWTNGDGNSKAMRTMVMNYDQYKAISRFAKDEGITLTPALQAQVPGEWIRKFGYDGTVFHDPNLGSVLLQIDDFAAYGVIDFLDLSHWEYAAPFGSGGFEMMPGQIGYWTQNTENDGSGEPSLFYSARGMQHYAFVPTKPRSDGRIFNLTVPS